MSTEKYGAEGVEDVAVTGTVAHLPDEHMSVGRYIATRIPSLKPPMARAPNPFKLLGLLNTQQWLFFLVAFIAWSWDAFDFFTVSLTLVRLSTSLALSPQLTKK